MRRAAGLGYVRLLRGRFQAFTPRVSGGAARSLGTYGSYEDADRVRAAAVEDLASRDRTRIPGVTLRAYGERVLNDWESANPVSDGARRSRWKHVLCAVFIDDPIETLTRRSILAWIRRLEKAQIRRGGLTDTISATHVRHVRGLLSQVLDEAFGEDLIPSNPATGIRRRKIRNARSLVDEDMSAVWTYLVPDEQRQIRECEAIDECDRLIISIAIWTGLRLGELTNLELRDVHADDAEPYVYVRWGSKGRLPKNGRHRRVPLLGCALADVRRWLEILPTYARRNPENLFWPRRSGRRRGVSRHLHHGDGNRLNGFTEALAAAGITRPVRWHDLRHTCGSSLIAGWWGGGAWSLIQVRDMLGHQAIRVTERYAHLAPSVLAEAAARTSGGGSGSGGSGAGRDDRVTIATATNARETSVKRASGRESCSSAACVATPEGYGSRSSRDHREASGNLRHHAAAVNLLRRLAGGDPAEAEAAAGVLLDALRAGGVTRDVDREAAPRVKRPRRRDDRRRR